MGLKRFTTYASSLRQCYTPSVPVRSSGRILTRSQPASGLVCDRLVPGGAATNTNGTLAVDGALTGTVALYGPG